ETGTPTVAGTLTVNGGVGGVGGTGAGGTGATGSTGSGGATNTTLVFAPLVLGEIPTVSTVGMVLFVFLLAGAGLFILAFRRTV
ncbi:MAG: hypothetical protein OQK55_01270, partial [Thermoanaerobaculales bacterium]|nr:hypothetical protein [Thermoanaerobaculales bacterium]